LTPYTFASSPLLRTLPPITALALLVACSGDDSAGTDTITGTTTAAATAGTTTAAATTGTTTAGTTTADTTTTGATTSGTTTAATAGETDTTTDTTTGGPVCPFEPIDGRPGFALETVADGFDRPLLVVPDPSNPDRLFVAEQGGRVKILEPGMTTAPADNFLFIDVKNAVPQTIGPEQGFLGFAFHPDFPADPRVYVNYNPAGQGAQPTVIDEFKLDPNDPNKVDPASRRTVIAIHQPAGNHNGGMIAFGPDGYLYIGMGDGGGSNDAFKTGRDLRYLHAKILRIGVEPDGAPDSAPACPDCPVLDGFDYTIPADNPFVGVENARPEIWAWGLRNPWRFGFDRDTDLLYAADVGQGAWEEIHVIDAGNDCGWSVMEGFHCFGGKPCDEAAGPGQLNADSMRMPIAEYGHSQGRCSVTGGHVYRACEVPAWQGVYFYGDYCTGEVWGLRWDGQSVQELGVIADDPHQIFGSGHDGHGRVLFTTVEINNFKEPINGRVVRIAPAI